MLQLECARCGEIQEFGDEGENVRCPGCGRRGPFTLFRFAPEELIDEAVQAISQDYDFYLNRGDKIGMVLCEERFFALMNICRGWST